VIGGLVIGRLLRRHVPQVLFERTLMSSHLHRPQPRSPRLLLGGRTPTFRKNTSPHGPCANPNSSPDGPHHVAGGTLDRRRHAALPMIGQDLATTDENHRQW
jgi:hypothetical protein